MTDYSTMSGPELVRAFNTMANSDTGKELGTKPVNRFADTEVGRKRCEFLESSIRARVSGLKAADFDSEAKEVTRTRTRTKKAAATDGGIFDEFKTATTRYRGKALAALHENLNNQVAAGELARAVYGKVGLVGPLKMVLRGLQASIKDDRLPYELKKEATKEGALSYGLYAKAKSG
jgi:hypothetical protein